MDHSPIITLLTDFGFEDEYVASLQGVLLSILPMVRIVHISHAVPPGDIRRAAFLLERTYSYYPRGTVHLAVVDPGVGTARKMLAVQTDNFFFIAPDNGLLSPVFHSSESINVYEITNKNLFRATPSNTFHGRDIMAPIAARLAGGLDVSEVGPQIATEQCVRLKSPASCYEDGKITGEVVRIDHFGNLCTNIPLAALYKAKLKDARITIKNLSIQGITRTYGATASGTALALADSHDFLEIAVANGSAAAQTGAVIGDQVLVAKNSTK